MDIKKLLVGGMAGSIAHFFLGWLIYGILLADYMANHPGILANPMRTEPDFMYLIIGNLAFGFLQAYIYIKANVNSMLDGFVTGGIIGLLMTVGYDCINYATSSIISKSAMAADAAAATLMTAVVGALIAFIIGMGKKGA